MGKRFDMIALFGAVLVVAAVLAGGCTTVEMSSAGSLAWLDVKGADGVADRAVMLANEGYYFLDTWPLVTGDVTWNGKNACIDDGISFFSDELRAERMADAIFRYAESRNCDLVDVVINNRSESQIGLFGVLDWFNTIIAYKGITYSGVLRPRK